jgi:hypothetical protein
MNINQLTVGMNVVCPEDINESSYNGKIISLGETINHNLMGTEYVWVEVQNNSTKRKSMWPSNRLKRI